jgi:hypothetical protein
MRTSRCPRAVARPDRIVVLLSLAMALLVGCASATAAPTAKLRVTFVGDSVSASINYTAAAQRALQSRYAIRLDLAVCRRLVAPSCRHEGSTPSTALQAVRTYGSGIGDVLVVNVGYNEGWQGYGRGIDQVMRAALRQGAHGVVWVTLKETRGIYATTNGAIRRAAGRWRQLVVADWNAYSAGRPWFGSDGLHLSGAGAEAIARFLRPYVRRAAGMS